MNISKREFLKGFLLSSLTASLATLGFADPTSAAAKDADAIIPLIPTPHRIRSLGGTLRIESGASITYDDPVVETNIGVFKQALRPFSEIKLEPRRVPARIRRRASFI